MKKYAIIVAGGSGQRMGNTLPKQFMLLGGKPILYYSVKAFLDAFEDIQVIVALPAFHLFRGEEIFHGIQKNIRITVGGVTRFQSVKNGLQLVHDTSVVFVHDAVRCLVSKDLIHRCYEQAVSKGSAIPAVAATDSIRIKDGSLHKVIDRSHVKIIQTPQTFSSGIILKSFEQPYQSSFTDEATVVEASGKEVFLVDGDHQNIKITRPVDLFIAEKLLEERSLK